MPESTAHEERDAPPRGPGVLASVRPRTPGDRYLLVIAGLAVPVVVAAAVWGRSHMDPVAITVLVGVTFLLAFDVEEESGARVGVSLSSTIGVASGVLTGPLGCAVVAAASVLPDRRRIAVPVRLFNVGMVVLVTVMPSCVYWLIGADPRNPLTPVGLMAHVGLPVLAVSVLQLLLNALLLGTAVQLRGGASMSRYAAEMLRGTGLAYLGGAVVSFLLVVLWRPAGVGAVSVLLVLAPLLVARWALRQHNSQELARERCVDTFVASLEVRWPGSQERSARMAELAGELAGELGLGGTATRNVQYAARLYDIGILARPVDAPRLTLAWLGGMSLDERETLRREVREGSVELLRGVRFLAPAADILRSCSQADLSPAATAVMGAVAVERRIWLAEYRGQAPHAQVEAWLRSTTVGDPVDDTLTPIGPGLASLLRRVAPRVYLDERAPDTPAEGIYI